MDSGFYRMTDEYFDRYVTVAVVDLKYFEPEEAKLILKNAQEGKNFTYKFTDAFGAVARSCSHCKSRK
jgi:aminopeptidase C